MVLKVKPKSFGPIFVQFNGSDILQYFHGEVGEFSPAPPVNSPVDTMIAALGSCIVKSIEWAADQRKVALLPFTVRLMGHKSPELPGRVEKVEIAVLGALVADETLTLRILKQAKSICTVSNTMNCDVSLTVEPGSEI